jgi:hypothetical protein
MGGGGGAGGRGEGGGEGGRVRGNWDLGLGCTRSDEKKKNKRGGLPDRYWLRDLGGLVLESSAVRRGRKAVKGGRARNWEGDGEGGGTRDGQR